MKFNVFTAKDNYKSCSHYKCEKDPVYISPTGRIIKGTSCLEVSFHVGRSRFTDKTYYCRKCVDLIFKDMKLNLDSRLWILS